MYKLTLLLCLLTTGLFCQAPDSTIIKLMAEADKWENNNFDSSMHFSLLALELSREREDVANQVNSLNNLGFSQANKSIYNEAYASHQEALALAREINDSLLIAKTYNFTGVYYNELSDYDEAQENFLNSYEIRTKIKDTVGMAMVGGNIGLNYYRLKQYDLAEKYLTETYRIDSMLMDSFFMLGDLINIGLVYKHTDRLDQAEEVTRQALRYSEGLAIKDDIALSLGNLGMIEIQRENYAAAEPYLREAIHMRRAEAVPSKMTISHTNLAVLYDSMGRYDLSLRHIDSASTYNLIAKSDRQAEKMRRTEVDVYRKLGNYERAFKLNVRLQKRLDSIASQDRLKKLASVEGRLNLLAKENDLAKKDGAISTLRIRNQRLAFGGAGLLGMLGIFYLLRSRSYSRRNASLQKKFAQDLIASTEQERKRISSELHDSIGQSLLLIKNKILLNPEEVKNDVGIVDDAISEVRSISQALHPFQFEKLGLLRSLEYLMEQFQSHSNIFYSADIDLEKLELPDNQGIYVYRIIQECINNVEKHSGAKACSLTVRQETDYILFQVRDNGHGFDLTENADLLNGLGMKTLRERAQIIGAQLVIDSTKGKGTIVEVRLNNT